MFSVVAAPDDTCRDAINAIGDILVDTPNGGTIPARSIANVRIGRSPNLIWRENAQRRIVVQANLAGRDPEGAISDLKQTVQQRVQLPPEYYVEYAGEF